MDERNPIHSYTLQPGLIFNKVFACPCPKTLNQKAKTIATRPQTGNF